MKRKVDCDVLDDTTLAQMIKDHGPMPCGQEHCRIEMANEFVTKAKAGKDPWRDVLELHVYSSLIAEQVRELSADNTARGAYLFDLVERLGGIVFMPPVGDIMDRPGILRLDDEDTEGGRVFKVIMPSKRAQEARRKRAA